MASGDNALKQKYSDALDLMSEGRWEECRQQMESLLKEAPEFLEVYEGLAVVLSRLDRLDEAIELMKALLKKDPENIMAHTNLSVFYMKKGMKDEAEEWKAKATVLQFSKRPKP